MSAEVNEDLCLLTLNPIFANLKAKLLEEGTTVTILGVLDFNYIFICGSKGFHTIFDVNNVLMVLWQILTICFTIRLDSTEVFELCI